MPVRSSRTSTNVPVSINLKLVLRILEDLRAFRTEHILDVDNVDGEFYYRCFVPGLDARLRRSRAVDRSDIPAIDNAADGLHMDFDLPTRIGFPALLHGQPLRMRTPGVETTVGPVMHNGETVPLETQVSMNVYSGSVRGEDVAQELAAASWRSRLAPPALYGVEENVVDVRIRMELINAFVPPDPTGLNSGYDAGHDRTAPFIHVVVPHPLPAEDAIASVYDAECVHKRQWHLTLAQGTGQDSETAMRTWTIALLKMTGLTFRQALSRWQMGDKGTVKVSAARFHEDKKRLSARVPEIRRYFMRQQRNTAGAA